EQDNLFKSTDMINATNFPCAAGTMRPWDASGGGAQNPGTYQNRVPMYNCPSDPSVDSEGNPSGLSPWKGSSYGVNGQVFGTVDANWNLTTWYGSARFPASFQDGTSSTIMIAERYSRCGSNGGLWAYWGGDQWLPAFAVSFNPICTGPASKWQQQPLPFLTNCDPNRASSPHSGVMVTGSADAHVQHFSAGLSPATW